jgi:predicted nucleotidyltransferase
LGKRAFRDRDFLSSRESFVFCVIGPYHPSDRVISYLKYLPDSAGVWKNERERFKRVLRAYTVPNLLETFKILENIAPHYLFFSQFYSIQMTAVQLGQIARHYRPETRLAELFRESRLDPLQRRAVRLVTLLSELSGVETRNLGLTGSLLLGIHSPSFSDIDIVVYGVENSYSVKNALTEAFSKSDLGVRRFGKERRTEWCARKLLNHPLVPLDAERIYQRKWNVGEFEGTMFSVHPVKLEGELTEKYGDKTYTPVGTVEVTAVVSDSRDSLFLPAVYRVSKVEGVSEMDIEEVVSYEGLYDSLAVDGETIKVRGKLEHVADNRTGRSYHRLLVGSPEGKGGEYIKPAN